MSTTTTARRRHVPGLAILGAAAVTGGTIGTAALAPAAHAEAHAAEIEFDLGTLEPGDEIPGGGGGSYADADLDLEALGIPDNRELETPDGFAFRLYTEDGALHYAYTSADVIEAHGYTGARDIALHTQTGETVRVVFDWDWSAAAPEDDEDTGDDGDTGEVELPTFYTGVVDTCEAGDIPVPLDIPDGVTIDEVHLDHPAWDDLVLTADGVTLVGYDPARMLGEDSMVRGSYTGTVDGEEAAEGGDFTLILNSWCGTDATLSPDDDGVFRLDLSEHWTNIVTGQSTIPGTETLRLSEDIDPDVGTLRAFASDGSEVEYYPNGDGPGGSFVGGDLMTLEFHPGPEFDGTFELTYEYGASKAGIAFPPPTVTFEEPPEPETPEDPEDPEEPEDPEDPEEPERPERPEPPREETPRVSE